MGLKTVAQCDCCGEVFEGTVYFLQVWAEDTHGGVDARAAAQNIQTCMNSERKKCYCHKCMEKIRKSFNF